MLIGYARVSTDDQNLDLQLEVLNSLGAVVPGLSATPGNCREYNTPPWKNIPSRTNAPSGINPYICT